MKPLMDIMRKDEKRSILPYVEIIASLVVLSLIISFLLSYFKPELLLLDTITNGGDTGSHNYPLHYMRDYLLPSGRLVGWMPDWYAGMPLFQFYFPMPFLIMSILSYAIPINIAFKIGTVLGTFALPIAVFLAAKLMKFKFPMPAVAAILTLLFLFNTGNSMWGGNIPSTLAGEFSYSISMAMSVLFLGLLYAGITSDKKRSKMIIISAAVFAFATMCHAYPVLFAAFASTFFLLVGKRRIKQNFIYLFKVYALAFLLVAFWLVPMVAKVGYSSVYHYVWNLRNIEEVLPATIQPLFLLAAFGAIRTFRNSDRRMMFLLYCTFIAVLLYAMSPHLGITDIRFIPFMQLFLVFPASYAICWVAARFKKVQFAGLALLAIVLVLTLYFTSTNERYIPDWIKWNYGGFEGKANWEQLSAITTYLRELPYGRVVHEYSNDHDKFGTPRTFESIPLFADKPVLEGLNIESALTAPYVFVIQSEISATQTCPIPGLKCSSFDIDAATVHLKQFNVRYVVATTPKLKDALKSNANYKFLKGFDEIEIYELVPDERSGFVTVSKYEPVLVQTDEWKELSLEWFRQASEVPIVFTDKITAADSERFKTTYADFSASDIGQLPKVTVDGCEITETVGNEEIELQLEESCIGKPLIVRVPYFPNWQVEGADKIYLVSSAFMLIYPEQTNVRIYYSNVAVDYVGYILTAIGLAVFAVSSFKLLSKPKP
jgi:hypothetical protein